MHRMSASQSSGICKTSEFRTEAVGVPLREIRMLAPSEKTGPMRQGYKIIYQIWLLKSDQSDISHSTMVRALTSLAMIATLFLGGLLSAPDAHADESFAGAHVADHLATHGLEHYADVDHADDTDGQTHPELHHHNCSFDVPTLARLKDISGLPRALPVLPFSDQAPHKRAQDVLKEPPKA